jgi:acyl-CoA synthetase (AMP-forming)/AMP-acid ligase II
MLEVTLKVPGLKRHDLSSLVVVGLGAAPTPPELVRRAQAMLRCTVVVGYGATEIGGGVLVTRMEDGEREQAETVGRPFPGAEVKIVDEWRRELPVDALGELACRSPGLMLGYHRQMASTAKAVDDNGWYYTGDLATMDARGFVRIVGRKRDLIIRGGYNVVPVEVESVLRNHPAVAQAAVVGVQDHTVGEAIWAFLVPARGAALHTAQVRGHCLRQLDSSKVPDHFRIIPYLPVGATGEVCKAGLRELARRQLRSPAEPGPSQGNRNKTGTD